MHKKSLIKKIRSAFLHFRSYVDSPACKFIDFFVIFQAIQITNQSGEITGFDVAYGRKP